MPKQKVAKKLPKRTTNAALKARRKASWERGQERKRERQREQDKRAARNRRLIADGKLTPWQLSKVEAKWGKLPQRMPEHDAEAMFR